jgi:hypothetical protein
MTTINDISDLVRILRDDPAWADAVRSVLLSQELLNLPKEVADLTRAVRENAETVNRRLEALEKGQGELRAGQEELRAGQQRLETNQQQLQSSVNSMRGELGNVSGASFQRQAAKFADRIARREFQLDQREVVHYAEQVEGLKLRPILERAADDNSRPFADNDVDEVERADAVISGKTPEGKDAYLLVEASIMVDDEDVNRARKRADLLQNATGATAHAVVIGRAITEDGARLAGTEGVTFRELPPRKPARES